MIFFIPTPSEQSYFPYQRSFNALYHPPSGTKHSSSPKTAFFASATTNFSFRSSIPNHGLHLGIYPDHLAVDLRVVAPHDLRVPARSDKDGIDAAGDWGSKDVGNLEADEEGESDDDGRVLAIVIVRRVGEEEVQIAQESAGVSDENGAKGQHGANETFLGRLA